VIGVFAGVGVNVGVSDGEVVSFGKELASGWMRNAYMPANMKQRTAKTSVKIIQ